MLIDLLILAWYFGGLAYAFWAWRLEFDLTLGTVLLAMFLCLILGPFLGVIWHLSWYFEHNPKKIPTITIAKKRDR